MRSRRRVDKFPCITCYLVLRTSVEEICTRHKGLVRKDVDRVSNVNCGTLDQVNGKGRVFHVLQRAARDPEMLLDVHTNKRS